MVEQAIQLLLRRQRLGSKGRILYVVVRLSDSPFPTVLSLEFQRAVAHDRADLGAGGRAVAVGTDIFEDPNPAFLQDVFGKTVVVGDAPG